jgi:hypothetical protein
MSGIEYAPVCSLDDGDLAGPYPTRSDAAAERDALRETLARIEQAVARECCPWDRGCPWEQRAPMFCHCPHCELDRILAQT